MNYETAKNQWETTCKRKLANNTYLTQGDGYFGVRLHSTEIIKFYLDKTVFDSGGWKTVTTKARINEFTEFSLWQKAGIWYITEHFGYNQTGSVFNDNCYFDGSWHGMGENPKKQAKLRKRAQTYAKNFVKALFAGKVKQPNGGDCWSCSMFAKAEMNSPDHILNHFTEKYYVPSLLVNATKRFPISIIAQDCIARLWQGHDKEQWGWEIAKRQIETSIKRYCYEQLGTAC